MELCGGTDILPIFGARVSEGDIDNQAIEVTFERCTWESV